MLVEELEELCPPWEEEPPCEEEPPSEEEPLSEEVPLWDVDVFPFEVSPPTEEFEEASEDAPSEETPPFPPQLAKTKVLDAKAKKSNLFFIHTSGFPLRNRFPISS
jgi:hypothetical protein